MKELLALAAEKILILDGAMGTMIQQHRLSESDFRGTRFAAHPKSVKGNNDLLCLTQPKIIEDIHLQYFEAGADIAETNTFNGQVISLADYGMEHLAYELNVAAAQCAVNARTAFYEKHGTEQPKFVAGAMGPTNRTASLSPDVNDPAFRNVQYHELVTAYKEQARGLLDGGADILIVETIFDTLNAKAAFFGILELLDELQIEVPLMASGTITDASGRTLSGQTAAAFAISLEHIPLISIGFNCALGAAQLQQYVEVLGNECDIMISAYPNAGLPNAMGEYDETPETMADTLEEYLQKNLVNILGGCCGTTPQHIAAIAKIANKYKPRAIKNKALA